MIVGLVGAFMTAAYMTRCVYLTFFGEYRGGTSRTPIPHGDEAEHDPADTTASIGARRARARPAREQPPRSRCRSGSCRSSRCSPGFLNAAPRTSRSSRSGSSRAIAFAEIVAPATFSWSSRPSSRSLIAVARHRRSRTRTTGHGAGRSDLAARNALARAGKRFLVKKYYLDVLYNDIIVGVDQGPDRGRRRTGSTSTSSTTSSTTPGAARARSRVHVRLHRPDGCRRCRQRPRDGHRRSRRRGARASRPVDCSSTHSCLFCGGRRCSPSSCGSSLSGGVSAR